MTIRMDEGAAELLDTLHRAGYAAYVVGGCVRDSLLGLTPHDWDLCTSALPQQVMELFGAQRCIPTGLQHGTVTVKQSGALYEITTFRTEGTYTDGRHPDEVHFVPDVREDLARRDLTINAMAYNEKEGLVDPFGGQADLQSGIVRAVGVPRQRFTEDALRILRLYRFAARFGFAIDPPTAQAAQELFKETPVKVTVYGRDEVERIGLTAFLEVGKGSIHEPKLIVMEYTGAQDVESRLGLIGKGLTYDSGGYSLQSSEFMETMQHDMSGAAAVMAALWATQKRGLRINITGVVAACENKLSATAYVPGDVIRSMSGRYIEVNNTDAEGRITLADAVTYTKQCCGVDRIVDIATLTDGIQTALGNRRCGAFTNNRALTAQVEKGAAAACERMWELPCDENLRRVLDSRVAHLKNSAMGSSVGGYATVGAMFVKEFVEETPWIHLDIGGTAWTTECEGIYTKGGIGFGTRMLYETFKVMEKEGSQV